MAQDNLPNIFPNHPHRQLYILLSVLVFVIVAGLGMDHLITIPVQKVKKDKPYGN